MTIRVELPDGHSCQLRTKDEMTNRQSGLLRKSTPAVARLQEKVKLARLNLGLPATAPVPAEGEDLSPEEAAANVAVMAQLDEDDGEAFFAMQGRAIVARLASWTLTLPDGTPRPLPTVDDVDDLEQKWFTPIGAAAAADDVASPTDFTADGGVEAGSPTVPLQP